MEAAKTNPIIVPNPIFPRLPPQKWRQVSIDYVLRYFCVCVCLFFVFLFFLWFFWGGGANETLSYSPIQFIPLSLLNGLCLGSEMAMVKGIPPPQTLV